MLDKKKKIRRKRSTFAFRNACSIFVLKLKNNKKIFCAKFVLSFPILKLLKKTFYFINNCVIPMTSFIASSSISGGLESEIKLLFTVKEPEYKNKK